MDARQEMDKFRDWSNLRQLMIELLEKFKVGFANVVADKKIVFEFRPDGRPKGYNGLRRFGWLCLLVNRDA